MSDIDQPPDWRGWISSNQRVGRDGLRHDRTCGDDRIVANRDPAHDDAMDADPYVAADFHRGHLGGGDPLPCEASLRRYRMIRVIEDGNVARDEGVVADAYPLGYANDASVVEADPVANNQLRIVSDVPCTGTADN